MHFYRNWKLRGKFTFFITLISVLFFIPYLVIFIIAGKGDAASVSSALPVVGAVLVLIWLLGVSLAFRLAKTVMSPAQKISTAAHDLALGALDVKVGYEADDEFGALAKDIDDLSDKVTGSVREIISLMESLAAGDYSVQSHIVWSGEWAQLNIAFRKTLDSLNNLVSRVVVASEQTSSGAEQVASGSQALAQGATEQASSIEELSATILEVSDHVKRNASNAAEANRSSSEEGEKLQDASSKMDEMMKAMSEISDTSKQIGNIIKTIDDIAFQTNILALNAAVEAARAGAAGKGFAVVADEVRNLASKSAEAAKNTTSLIENSIKAVSNGTKVADSTEKTLLEVITSANRTNELVNEIANASNQQATSINQITQGVQQISAVVQTNSATAEESAAASEELSAQAKEVRRLIAGIKLRGVAQKPAAAPKAETAVKSGAVGKLEAAQQAAKTEPAAAQAQAVPVSAGVKAADKYI